jgi:hypothetical protein
MSNAKSLFRYPAVAVKWLDAHARNQAVEYEESEIIQQHRPEPCLTLGLMVKRDDTGITLYTEETGPTAVRGVNFIPAAMIEDVIELNLTRKRKPNARKVDPQESPSNDGPATPTHPAA